MTQGNKVHLWRVRLCEVFFSLPERFRRRVKHELAPSLASRNTGLARWLTRIAKFERSIAASNSRSLRNRHPTVGEHPRHRRNCLSNGQNDPKTISFHAPDERYRELKRRSSGEISCNRHRPFWRWCRRSLHGIQVVRALPYSSSRVVVRVLVLTIDPRRISRSSRRSEWD